MRAPGRTRANRSNPSPVAWRPVQDRYRIAKKKPGTGGAAGPRADGNPTVGLAQGGSRLPDVKHTIGEDEARCRHGRDALDKPRGAVKHERDGRGAISGGC